MNDHLEAITKYVEAINATLPEGIDGEGPIRQMLGEIIAEAMAVSRPERARGETVPVRLSVEARNRLRALAKAEGKTIGVMLLELIDNRELRNRNLEPQS